MKPQERMNKSWDRSMRGYLGDPEAPDLILALLDLESIMLGNMGRMDASSNVLFDRALTILRDRIAIDRKRMALPKSFSVVTAGRAFDQSGKEEASFGTLADEGILSKQYRSTGIPGAEDIVWTVLVPRVTINGKEYQQGQKIVWPK